MVRGSILAAALAVTLAPAAWGHSLEELKAALHEREKFFQAVSVVLAAAGSVLASYAYVRYSAIDSFHTKS